MTQTPVVKRNSHCGFCGALFDDGQAWPRTCTTCGRTTYLNPLPVAVVVVPIDGGVLAVRRGIEPKRGMLALPGGYIGLGETWQEAGAREVYEETGITIDATHISDIRTLSAPDSTILIFGLAAPMHAADLPAFMPTNETTETVVLSAPQELAFSLHTQVLAEYFAKRQQS